MKTKRDEAMRILESVNQIIQRPPGEYSNWLMESAPGPIGDRQFEPESAYGVFINAADEEGVFNGILSGDDYSKGAALVQKVLGYTFNRELPPFMAGLKRDWDSMPADRQATAWWIIGSRLRNLGKPLAFIIFGAERPTRAPYAALYHYGMFPPGYCLERIQEAAARRRVNEA